MAFKPHFGFGHARGARLRSALDDADRRGRDRDRIFPGFANRLRRIDVGRLLR
jgi:hypothetical protein